MCSWRLAAVRPLPASAAAASITYEDTLPSAAWQRDVTRLPTEPHVCCGSSQPDEPDEPGEPGEPDDRRLCESRLLNGGAR